MTNKKNYQLHVAMLHPNTFFEEIKHYEDWDYPLYKAMIHPDMTYTIDETPNINQPDVLFESHNLELLEIINSHFKGYDFKITEA